MTQQNQIQLWKKLLLRLSILFILLLSIPLQGDFYRILTTISWTYFLTDIFNLVTFLPHYFGEYSSLYDWILTLGVALIGALVWLRMEKETNSNREASLFYFLRIFARFKLAAILFIAGFLKVFPVFVPELSISHLNTGYGYFEDWKHLLLSLSVAPAYLVFLGIVELIAAFLLLFRKTSFLAVIFIIPFYGNAFLGDLAYEGPAYLVSIYIVLLTLPIFFYDAQRLGSLIVALENTKPAFWVFEWRKVRGGRWRIVLKLIFSLVFIGLIGVKSYVTYQQPTISLHYPEEPGLPVIAGKYIVDSFVLNGDTLAYSPDDTLRWKDVVFEQWNTLSVRKENTVIKSEKSLAFLQRGNTQRDYEYTQVGDRLYYRYTIDGDKIVLKNPNENYGEDSYVFQVVRPDSLHVNLLGTNLKKDSLEVALHKVDKKYLLYEVKKVGRRSLGYKL
ncbi:hypothetical protein [Sphingobacterium sp. LRF_L2]|uniref:hypothetical protein n=1 Tax=Sphingobacterium sp. LRF_L2 TaxID=3369421 RepID=UPI003F611885